MHNLVVEFTFFCFRQDIPFLDKFGPKNQNCLSWNLVPRLIGICTIQWSFPFFCFCLVIPVFGSMVQSSTVVFTFSVFQSTRNMLFGKKLVQKIKTVSLRGNLVPKLVQICRSQWSLFLFYRESALFGQIWSKRAELSL